MNREGTVEGTPTRHGGQDQGTAYRDHSDVEPTGPRTRFFGKKATDRRKGPPIKKWLDSDHAYRVPQ